MALRAIGSSHAARDAVQMSRKGNCGTTLWPRALHTLKTELIYLEDFDTHEQAQTAVFEYIEVFYNRQRCHSANGYLAPLAYEQALKTNEISMSGKVLTKSPGERGHRGKSGARGEYQGRAREEPSASRTLVRG